MQQLRDALPLPCSYYRYILFDRDAKFGSDVLEFLKASDIRPIRTSARSPWQNGITERWVGSARREMLDHVIPLNQQHLRRLGREYLREWPRFTRKRFVIAQHHRFRSATRMKRTLVATGLLSDFSGDAIIAGAYVK